jgi:hypothetical protein
MDRVSTYCATAGLLAAVLVAACGDEQAPQLPPSGGTADEPLAPDADRACGDIDLDGYGLGCAAGPDCDDANPLFHDGCLSCGRNPQHGCPCDAEEDDPVECHSGAPAPDERGRLRCLAGQRSCEDGAWSECVYTDSYLTGPGEFRSHNDPTGRVQCTNCDPQCFQTGGLIDAADVDAAHSNGAAFVGGVVISGTAAPTAPYAYMPLTNYRTGGVPNRGAVAKINVTTGAEVARYYVGLANTSNRPSRAAIDSAGDVYVANRANSGAGGQGSATKLAGTIGACLNGALNTSKNSNALPINTDDCVLWTANIGGANGSVPRGLTIDRGDVAAPNGYPWVAAYNDVDTPSAAQGRLYRLDPVDGSELDAASVPFHPRGIAVDDQVPQRVWLASGRTNELVAIRTDDLSQEGPYWPEEDQSTIVNSEPYNYGITFDGDHVWMASPHNTFVEGYEIATGNWCVVDLGWTAGRGLAVRVNPDSSRTVWVAHSLWTGRLSYFDVDFTLCVPTPVTGDFCDLWGDIGCTTMAVGATRNVPLYTGPVGTKLTGQRSPWGLDLDSQNRVWTGNNGSNNITVYDPDLDTLLVYPTTPAPMYSPHAVSDFTGYQRSVFTVTEGSFWTDYGTAFQPCPAGTETIWGDLRWTAVVPVNTTIRWEAQAALTEPELPGAPIVVLGTAPADASPLYVQDALDAGGLVGRRYPYLRITAVLTSLDGVASPLLTSQQIDWACLDSE